MSTQFNDRATLSELELYELFLAAYPDIYEGQDEDDALWDRVLEHADDVLSDPEAGMNFLARLVYLTNPMKSSITGRMRHCLGRVDVNGDTVRMTAAVSRQVETEVGV